MDTDLNIHMHEYLTLIGESYYRLELACDIGYIKEAWFNDSDDIRNACLNLVYLTINDVQQTHRLVINYLSSNKEEFNFITEEPRDGEYVWVSDLLSPEFVSLIKYDSSWNPHRQLFKNHLVFVTEDLAVKASKSIIQILRREAARKRFKPLTKAPQDGTTVYLADVTSKYGYKSIVYTKEFEHLLNYRLLYPDIYEAIQASTAMRQLINPVVPEFTS